MRLSVVTTTMPLVADDAIDFGLQDFCRTCNKCAENCPSGAISTGDKKMIRGVERYEFDPMKCMIQRSTTGCAACAGVCPFTKQDNLVHSAGRIIGQNSLGAQFLKGLDDLFYGASPAPRELTPDLVPWRL
jgi:epoxyqueuosine reductase QueG